LYCIKVLQENLIAKTIDNGCTHNLKPLRLKVLGEKKKSQHVLLFNLCWKKCESATVTIQKPLFLKGRRHGWTTGIIATLLNMLMSWLFKVQKLL